MTEKDLGPEPWHAFGQWMDKAEKESGLPHPNAMSLATLGPDDFPQVRIVLLKGWDQKGLRFYTNYRSQKSMALDANPKAELCFHWDALGRQVRAQGPLQRCEAEDSDAYFASRPRESQLSAWASEQSQPVASREAMDARYAEMEASFAGKPVSRPPHWGGWRLSPERFEFWQQGQHRFHDRFVFLKKPGGWALSRLNP